MELRPLEAGWTTEYEFLRAFPGYTHDAYLDTPNETISWLLRVHRIHQEYEAEQKAKARAAQQ